MIRRCCTERSDRTMTNMTDDSDDDRRRKSIINTNEHHQRSYYYHIIVTFILIMFPSLINSTSASTSSSTSSAPLTLTIYSLEGMLGSNHTFVYDDDAGPINDILPLWPATGITPDADSTSPFMSMTISTGLEVSLHSSLDCSDGATIIRSSVKLMQPIYTMTNLHPRCITIRRVIEPSDDDSSTLPVVDDDDGTNGDPHLLSMHAWQATQYLLYDPFTAPMYATMYEFDDFKGRSFRVALADGVDDMQYVSTSSASLAKGTRRSWHVRSFRVIAGCQLILCPTKHCGDANAFTYSVSSMSATSFAAPSHEQPDFYLRVKRLRPSDGFMLFPVAYFRGAGRYVSGFARFDEHERGQLEAGFVAGSIFLAPDALFTIVLHAGDAGARAEAELAVPITTGGGGGGGKFWTRVTCADIASNASSTLANALVASLTIDHFCPLPCQNESFCLGHGSCACSSAYTGSDCSLERPDLTSFVSCDRREYFHKEHMQCTLVARRGAREVRTTKAAFLGTIVDDDAPRTGGWELATRHIDPQTLTSRFAFSIVPDRAVCLSASCKAVDILRVSVNLSFDHPRRMLDMDLRELEPVSARIFARPDATSSIECEKHKVLLYEKITCTIVPRRDGRRIVTLTRAFHASVTEGMASLTKIVAVNTPRTPQPPSLKTKNKPKLVTRKNKNERVGSTMQFHYTALPQRDQRRTSELRVKCNWDPLNVSSSTSSSAPSPSSSSSSSSSSSAVTIVPCFLPFILVMNHSPPASSDHFGQAKQLVYLSLFQSALPLLRAALETQPGHRREALVLRSELHLLMGSFAECRADLVALKSLSSAAAASGRGDSSARVRMLTAKFALLSTTSSRANRGLALLGKKKYLQSLEHLSSALSTSRYSTHLHLARALVGLETANYSMLRYDVLAVLNLERNNPAAIRLLAQGAYRILGNLPNAVDNLKTCVRYAPNEHPEQAQADTCASVLALYESLASLISLVESSVQRHDWPSALAHSQAIIDLDSLGGLDGPSATVMRYKRCGFLLQSALYAQAVDACAEGIALLTRNVASKKSKHGLELDQSDASAADREFEYDLYLDRAHVHFATGNHVLTKHDLDHVLTISLAPSAASLRSARASTLSSLLTAALALAAAPARDFYSILNLLRSATRAEVKRAYRLLALRWHPDKNLDLGASQKFQEITEAFKALYDEFTRAKYDAGMSEDEMRREQTKSTSGEGNAPFDFNFEDFSADGKARAWFINAEGEKEYTEFDTDDSIKRAKAKADEKSRIDEEERKKEIQKHCCLPMGMGE